MPSDERFDHEAEAVEGRGTQDTAGSSGLRKSSPPGPGSPGPPAASADDEDREPEDTAGSADGPPGPDEGAAGDSAEALRAERDELLDTVRRVQADFENFRKRVMRDHTVQVERAGERLVEELLPVLDSFELAVLNVPAGELDETSANLRKGVELVYAELFGVLEKAGLERVDALQKPFDPNEHEAVMRDEGDGEPVVTEVMRHGYRFKGRIVRPAMVRVGPAS